ncbi:MAG: DUF1491 family protein [Hyphomicrobiaceae bacterium]
MRLRSDIWVKAYLRVVAAQGAHAVVVKHGDDDAGAIYIKIVTHDRTARVFGPAPAGLDGAEQERKWIALSSKAVTHEAEVDRLLEREAEFDPDLWIVEVEDRDGRCFLEDWLQLPDA